MPVGRKKRIPRKPAAPAVAAAAEAEQQFRHLKHLPNNTTGTPAGVCLFFILCKKEPDGKTGHEESHRI